MVEIDILSCPAALPDLNELAMMMNSSFVAELKEDRMGKLFREIICVRR